MPSDPFYSSSAWIRVRNLVRRRDMGKPCPVCGALLEPHHKLIVDHVTNRRLLTPAQALDPLQCQLVHHVCNSRKASWIEGTHGARPKAVGKDGFPEGGWGDER